MTKENSSDDPDGDCTESSGNGSIHFYFKDIIAKRVRTTSIYCPTCFPDSRGTRRGPRPHEEEIDFAEAFKLIHEEGWFDNVQE